MPTTYNYKILGQLAPTNTSETTLYTVPASTQAVISTLVLIPLTTSAAAYRVSVRPSGGTVGLSMYRLISDLTLPPGASVFVTGIGITLGAGDIVSVLTGTANAIGFHLYGSEYV